MILAPVAGKVVWDDNALSETASNCQPNNTNLQHPHCNADCISRTSQSALVIGDRPRIAGELLQDACELEFTLGHGEQEPRRSEVLREYGLAWTGRRTILGT